MNWTATSILTEMKVKPLSIEGLPESIYHSIPAMSASGLKYFRKSPGDWKYMRDNPSGDSEARRWGRLIHIVLSEPQRVETSVAVIDGHRGNKEVKAAVEKAEAAGQLVIKPEKFATAMEIAVYARNHHNVLKVALKNGIGERSLFWIDPESGAPCKARLDWLTKDSIFDWKTFDEVHSEDGLESQIRKMFYDYQDVWYSEGFYRVFGRQPKRFHHAFIQEGPVKIQLTEIAQVSREEITPYIRQHLFDFAECLKKDEWPLNDGEIKEIVIKPWRN